MRCVALLAPALAASLVALSVLAGCATRNTVFPPHPGTITYRADDGRPDQVAPVDEVPERSRFVLLDRNGRETQDPAQAVRREPIVEVVMTGARDPTGPRSIREYGPGRTLWRSTLMVHSPSPPPRQP